MNGAAANCSVACIDVHVYNSDDSDKVARLPKKLAELQAIRLEQQAASEPGRPCGKVLGRGC